MTKKEFYDKFVANRKLGIANIILGISLVILGIIIDKL
jgi:hypothetical protein